MPTLTPLVTLTPKPDPHFFRETLKETFMSDYLTETKSVESSATYIFNAFYPLRSKRAGFFPI